MAKYDETWFSLGISEKEYNDVIKKSVEDHTDEWKKIVVETKSKKRCKKTDYMWLTINPKPDITLRDFIRAIDQFKELKPIDSYRYVYEQRGSTEEEKGKGFHLHMLIKRHGKPFLLTNAIHRIFDKMVGIPDKHIVEVWIDKHQLEEKGVYLQGNKSGKDKLVKSQMDVVWRVENGLEQIYENLSNPSVFTC